MMKKISVPLMVVSEMNKREHWRAAHARHKKQKEICKKHLLIEDVPRMLPVRITMIRIGKRKLDSDNLQGAFKYVRDAIAEYFFPNLAAGRADDSELLFWDYSQEKGLPSIQILFDWDLNTGSFLSKALSHRLICFEDEKPSLSEILPVEQ
jgi:hypothetical protein